MRVKMSEGVYFMTHTGTKVRDIWLPGPQKGVIGLIRDILLSDERTMKRLSGMSEGTCLLRSLPAAITQNA